MQASPTALRLDLSGFIRRVRSCDPGRDWELCALRLASLYHDAQHPPGAIIDSALGLINLLAEHGARSPRVIRPGDDGFGVLLVWEAENAPQVRVEISRAREADVYMDDAHYLLTW